MNCLSLIIPVLNEEHNVKPLVERIHATMCSIGHNYELIFVDDRSTDKTATQIKLLSKKYPIVYSLKKGQRGKAFSLLEGFKLAKYELLGIIDADLQYPPEALKDMLAQIDKGAGVVVANRTYTHENFLRKLSTYTFRAIFAQWLHGFKVDVQSGLKLFKREIIERVYLKPSPWTFDLEFLIQARAAGYKVEAVPVEFGKRATGFSKINIFAASFQIGKEALRLKLTPPPVIYLTKKDQEKSGEGFHFKGVKFVHHSELEIGESAIHTLHSHQKIILIFILLALLSGLLFDWKSTLTGMIAVLTTVYFIDLFFNLFLIIRSLSKTPELKITEEEINTVVDKDWPTYTIFCPLYKEWEVVPQFVEAIKKLEYPKQKLQVQLLLEEDDTETIQHVKAYNLPHYFQVIIVPHSLPKTKPKACNYGLKFATGEYAVIYDAEDIPDPLQLKKAVLAFNKLPKNVICIQAKLNYYNPHQNLLTRLFTSEYSLWFDLILTGLQSINAPIPLGGTSNHFKTPYLKNLHGWDSFNVTEDCDLGMRLVKHGYRTAMVDSTTMEEANSDLKNWINQRTRWIKGYMQTYLVHMRKPSQLWKGRKEPHLITFQLIVGGKILSLFINPLLWTTTFLYFAFRPIVGPTIEEFFPGPVFYMGVFCLLFGNFLYFYYYMIGCAKRKQYSLIKYAYLTPIYWLAMSYAAWKASVQLFNKPHFWPKTIHGLHLKKTPAQAFTAVSQTVKVPVQAAMPVPEPETQLKERPPKSQKSTNFVEFMFSPFIVVGKSLSWLTFVMFHNMIDLFSLFLPNKTVTDNKQVKKTKKILIFNWRDTKHIFAGGAEVYIQELAKRWVQKGYVVTLFCGNDGHDPSYEIIDGVEIIRRGGFYFVYIWAFLYYMMKFRGQYDVILDCENGIPFFTPLFAKEKIYLVIHHVHQEVFRRTLHPLMAQLALFLELRLMPLVYRDIQVITVSESSKIEIMKLKKFKKNPIIIHNGVDLDFFKPGAKSDTPIVLYLGRLQYYKSLNIFIKAAREIIRSIPNVKFIIAGFGEERERLEKFVEKLHLQDTITFMGKVSNEKKRNLYQQAWVFVNPSLVEGWGITTIEANACGTPVVASQVAGLRDSVKNPHTGYLVPYGDVTEFAKKIEYLLTNKQARVRMSREALNWAKEFNWDTSAEKYLKIID